MPNELNICVLNCVSEVLDVVALPWIDGVSLDKLLGVPHTDYRKLSQSFDRLALGMLSTPRTHGDIKPANIIVRPCGDMHFIDYDASWQPGFTLADVEEVGTPAFCHPQHGITFFDKRVDDFAIALVSVMLAALAYRRAYFEPYIKKDGSLFVPVEVVTAPICCLMMRACSLSVRPIWHTSILRICYLVVMDMSKALPMLLGRRCADRWAYSTGSACMMATSVPLRRSIMLSPSIS